MKKVFTLLMAVTTVMPGTFLHAQVDNQKFAVISDVHVMSPELLKADGQAFKNYLKHDRKLLKESTAILKELTIELLNEKPEFVLLSGDLTKDGEEVSHRYLVDSCLNKLLEAGIQTLVIPGNHDINNPHARAFNGLENERVKTISPTEFANIYKKFGYEKALVRDNHSLSYVYQINDNTRILALDASRYDDNDFDNDICYHDGRLKPETEEFIRQQLKDAQMKGMKVIGMMHHGLLEHWKYQNKVIPGYVVDDWKRISRLLSKGGMKVIFTGHSHAQDIVYKNGIFDIETGSTVSYPTPYRIINMDDNEMKVTTRRIKSIEADINGLDFKTYSRENTSNGFKFIVRDFFPENIPDSLATRIADCVADAMCENYNGDEMLTDERKKEVKTLGKELKKYSRKMNRIFKAVVYSLCNDRKPKDNDVTINL